MKTTADAHDDAVSSDQPTSSSSSSFPFSTVVVTSPSFTSAQSSSTSGPLAHLASTLPSGVRVLGTSDPYGARCGSGGGTIAALDYADAHPDAASTKDDVASGVKKKGSVLIVHAGGESSRCPTQMVLGKAWSSLPVAAGASSSDANNNNNSSNSSNAPPPTPPTPQNPTALLVSELSTLLRDLPQGSVVVAASDVLLGLPSGISFDFDSSNASNDALGGEGGTGGHDAVIGLAVPAPLMTAKNHGVYVLEPYIEHVHDDDDGDELKAQAGNGGDGGSSRSRIRLKPRTVAQFLQKPSPDLMQHTRHCTFGDDLNYEGAEGKGVQQEEEEECAWIDTGVVVFLPRAAAKLRELVGVLSCCTHRGLEAMYKERGDTSSMEDFAKENTVKVELYTHLMLALSTTSDPSSSLCEQRSSSLEAYVNEHTTPKVPAHLLTEVYSSLSSLPFRAAAVPSGRFVHLGTTSELLDFLVGGCLPASTCAMKSDAPRDSGAAGGGGGGDASSIDKDAGRRSLGHKLGLCGRFNSFLLGVGSGPDNILLSSTIVCSDPVTPGEIGSGTVVEHTSLRCPRLVIGNKCLISGLRGSSSENISIPYGMCMQMLPLRKNWDDKVSNGASNGNAKAGNYYVYMFFGVADPIKAAERLYGLPIDDLLKATSLVESDLWDESIEERKRMLWNAKIHPVVWLESSSADANDVILDLKPLQWISALLSLADRDISCSEEARSSLDLWRSLPRLSFSKIRNLADPAAEFAFRDGLNRSRVPETRNNHMKNIEDVMRRRKHTPTDFGYAVDTFASTESIDDVQDAFCCLDGIVLGAIEDGDLDVAGRAFMVLAGFLSDLASKAAPSEDNIVCNKKEFQTEINALRFSKHSGSTQERRMQASRTLFSLRDEVLSCNKKLSHGEFNFLAMIFEQAAFALTEVCVRSSGPASTSSRRSTSFDNTCSNGTSPSRNSPLPIGSWAVATAPARIDLSGGWTDTPPISYEHGGAVAGLAVRLDGRRPLSARCRVVPSVRGVKLHSEGRDLKTGALQRGDLASAEQEDVCSLSKVSDLSDFRSPLASCALLKCALIYLGLVSLDQVRPDNDEDLQPYINKFYQSSKEDVGLEVISTSLLPKGSGLGTSSILGGCILASIERCVGSNVIGFESGSGEEKIVGAVLTLEQLLTTGGGWQDQVNGLVGGMKVGTSPSSIPLRTAIERIPMDPSARAALDQRLILAFTGQPRLAKNILVNVLRRWAQRAPEITQTVRDLVIGAREAADAIQASDIDKVGACLGKYWKLKKIMAGLESGVEPRVVADVLETLENREAIVGGSLCGAGGGGFLALLTSDGVTFGMICDIVDQDVRKVNDDVALFSWHSASVDEKGLSVQVQGPSGKDFDITWHDSYE